MQQAPGGARRPLDDQRTDRARATATNRLSRLGSRIVRAAGSRVQGRVAAASDTVLGAFRPFTTAERALPLAVASIVAVAALFAFLPNTPAGAVGGVQGSGSDVRLAVNGGVGRDGSADDSGGSDGAVEGDGGDGADLQGLFGGASFAPVVLPSEITTQPGSEQASLDGPVLDDGTLVTGYAPLTTVEDGADLIETYTVKAGDTLVTIAREYKVSVMTLWWANKLKTKDDLRVGQVLRIPPVSGLIHTVRDTDTLDSLATEYKVSAESIIRLNGLDDPTLVVGQVLVLPGAKGAPIPTPTPKPRTSSGGSSGGTVSGPVRYTGGAFKWPVVGGGNYISQYFHYGHYGIDIAADYGSRVVAAAGGRVIFAGWKSNGGGYQVWIAHGDGLYTTYNHMSAVLVGRGQTVARGQQVGRIGQSGHATGPHLHFEVWKGMVWDGGTRVNPLRYY